MRAAIRHPRYTGELQGIGVLPDDLAVLWLEAEVTEATPMAVLDGVGAKLAVKETPAAPPGGQARG